MVLCACDVVAVGVPDRVTLCVAENEGDAERDCVFVRVGVTVTPVVPDWLCDLDWLAVCAWVRLIDDVTLAVRLIEGVMLGEQTSFLPTIC